MNGWRNDKIHIGQTWHATGLTYGTVQRVRITLVSTQWLLLPFNGVSCVPLIFNGKVPQTGKLKWSDACNLKVKNLTSQSNRKWEFLFFFGDRLSLCRELEVTWDQAGLEFTDICLPLGVKARPTISCLFFFWNMVLLNSPGSKCWAKVILLSQPPDQLGLQVYGISPGWEPHLEVH